jgi:hypothetical protein
MADEGLLEKLVDVAPLDPATKAEVKAGFTAFHFVAALVGVLLLVALGSYLAVQLMGWRIGKAEQTAETATDAQVSATLSNWANQQVTAKAADNSAVLGQLKDKLNVVSSRLAALPHATDVLPDSDVATLRMYDDSLCNARPSICEGRADSGPAESGRDTADAPVVPALPPS